MTMTIVCRILQQEWILPYDAKYFLNQTVLTMIHVTAQVLLRHNPLRDSLHSDRHRPSYRDDVHYYAGTACRDAGE